MSFNMLEMKLMGIIYYRRRRDFPFYLFGEEGRESFPPSSIAATVEKGGGGGLSFFWPQAIKALNTRRRRRRRRTINEVANNTARGKGNLCAWSRLCVSPGVVLLPLSKGAKTPLIFRLLRLLLLLSLPSRSKNFETRERSAWKRKILT